MRIPLVETTAGYSGSNGRAKYADCRPLPASYMSEYSVLGIVVGELDQAIEVLSGEGFHIDRAEFGAEMEISGPARLPGVVRILRRAGIWCSIGDVIDSVYQG